MSIIDERKNLLREEFEIFDNPQDKFEYIISKSKNTPGLDASLKTEANLVQGCVSNLWLAVSFENGVCDFKSDADSIITKGIANLVCGMYGRLTPQEILDFDCAILEEVGISQYLSPNRRNGLSQLCGRISDFARALSV